MQGKLLGSRMEDILIGGRDKMFEDKFSEIQTDMIAICLEYANYAVDTVYIYASFEANIISCDYFYKINNKLVERHKLDTIGEKYDVSVERQGMCLNIILEDVERLFDLCREYKRDMPTEIKIIYDAKRNSVNADYKYDLQYSNDPIKTSDDVFEEWFQVEKKRIDSGMLA